MNIKSHSDYFLQNPKWTSNWQIAQGGEHKIFEVKTAKLKCYIYQYPWHNKKMWYTGKGPILIGNSDTLEIKEFEEFITKLTRAAKENKVIFVKLDLNDNITSLLNLGHTELNTILNKLNFKTNPNAQSLQYTQCAILDLKIIPKTKASLTIEEFMIEAVPLFQTFSKTRKSAINRVFRKYKNNEITFDCTKTEANFDAFWQTHLDTYKRQGLTPNSKEYVAKMLQEPFSRLVVGYDQTGKPCTGWYGVVFDNTMYYLLGGNNEVSMYHNWQTMLEMIVFQVAVNEGIVFYDFGGYDDSKGYGQYKTRYNPIVRSFVEPIDLIIDNKWYQLFNVLKTIKNKLKK